MSYQKHFVPLESDPEIFTRLMRDLGMSESLKFIDVWSIQEQVVARPVLALIVIFPDKDTANTSVPGFERRELANGVLWFKQTINNACGLYALLHAVCNGSAKDFVRL
jgi:ubiquitin carboxyl-terminal hydrolase L3